MIKSKLLLVDDERIIRDEFIRIFQNSRYELETASNSIEGLEKIINSQYDLVILDIRMPDLKNRFSETAGIELLNWIKKVKPQLKVIMLSVINDLDIAVRAMKLGARDYIVKDKFKTEELFLKIEDALNEVILSLIKNGESELVEFKSSLLYDIINKGANKELGKIIVKSISGFMNSKGGNLFIGINDKGELIGIENDFKIMSKKTNDAFLTLLYQIVVDHIGKEFCQKIHPDFLILYNKKICLIKIDPSSKPAWFLEGKSQTLYIRAGQSTRPLNPKETLEYVSQRFKQ